MYFAADVNKEDLNKLHEIERWSDEPKYKMDPENTSACIGAGSPYPSTPRSERQYHGFLPD